jgi:hypothetical protein
MRSGGERSTAHISVLCSQASPRSFKKRINLTHVALTADTIFAACVAILCCNASASRERTGEMPQQWRANRER